MYVSERCALVRSTVHARAFCQSHQGIVSLKVRHACLIFARGLCFSEKFEVQEVFYVMLGVSAFTGECDIDTARLQNP